MREDKAMADEHSLNSNLAEILRQAGLDAEPQVSFKDHQGKLRTPDLVCKVQGQQIGIEAKMRMGGKLSQPIHAINQADDLIEKSFCDAAIGLIYPDGYQNQDHLQTGKVDVAMRTPLSIGKKNAPQWKECEVKDLAGLIRSIPTQLSKSEELSKRAEIAVNQAAKKFTQEDIDSIQSHLRKEDANELAEVTNFKGLLVDLLTCFMFHYKLDTIIKDQPPFRKQANRPPILQACIDSENRISRFIDVYQKWLKIDYKDILAWNIDILKALTISEHRGNDAVHLLALTAQSIQMAKGEMPRDVVGTTFCNEIKDAKEEGAMYTTLPAATLLTHLMFHNSKINWKNTEKVKQLRIVDFACGSGTLLVACANYILQKLREKKVRKKDREEVAQALFEQMLYGFDCNRRAIFQTATGLGMIAPSVQFDKTQLRAMPLGEHPERKEEVRLGSLEMLLDNKDDWYFYQPLGQGELFSRLSLGQKPDSQPEPVECDTFHFAIMNPPFTIREKRHKQKKSEVEKKLREREEYFRQINHAMSAAGNSTAFIQLVHKYIDKQTGKAGIVLPTTITSGVSSKKARLWIAKHFQVQYIIVSYDPKRIFFSGFTSITEMLLVLERKKKTPTATKVIKLTNNPVHETDAYLCARAILSGQEERWEKYGEVDEISPADMAKGDWSATQFLSNDLYRIAKEIPNHWTSTLGKQVKIKMRGAIVRIGVQKCHPGKLHATPCLYSHKTEYCDKLEVQPDCHVKPKKDKPDFVNSLERVSRLKIAERVRLTTVKNLACRTTVSSVGSEWYTAEVTKKITNVDEETVEKAVCLILNSTPAKVGMIFVRAKKDISYVQFPTKNINRIPMPDLDGMKPSAFRALAKVYEEWCKQPRKRLPQAHECSVQLAIDQAVCRHTGYPEKLCREARRMLSYEPMVTGKPYQPNPKETNSELF